MATVKRSVLKELVKECLVEILVEGLSDDNSVEQLSESYTPKKRRRRGADNMTKKMQQRKKMLREKIVAESSPQKTAKDYMGSMTDDPVMAQIFAETAQTTLPAMIAGDVKGKTPLVAADGAAQLVQDNQLEDLFEGTANWANLAFSATKKAP